MEVSGWSTLRRVAHRLVSSDEQLAAEDMAASVAQSGIQSIADIRPRDRVTLAGEIVAVVVGASDRRRFEADLFDGSGTVTLLWLGRGHIRGVEVGRRLRAWGRVTPDGERLVMYNPGYALAAQVSE